MSPEARERAFDALATEMASGSISRGKALRLMGVALVGGTLSSFGIGGIAAADDLCKPGGKKCKKDKQCCSGTCGEDHKCTSCTSEGGSCAADADCCTNICDGETLSCATCRGAGNSCTTDRECCGVCKGPTGNRTCRDSCIPETTTCVDFCTNPLCTCRTEASGQPLCASFLTTTSCTTSCDCPQGQFCTAGGVCAQACV